jgi:hypothetical protein
VGYDIRGAYTFFADEIIHLYDLKMQIHDCLELVPSQFNINICVRINTAPAGSGGFFIICSGLFLMKFGE